MLARMAMMAITTNSSIKVNPFHGFFHHGDIPELARIPAAGDPMKVAWTDPTCPWCTIVTSLAARFVL